jgi:hypothetical protein
VFFLKTLHCFIPARWTNQQAAGGALSATGQVTKKVAEGKDRVGTPAGHHPLHKNLEDYCDQKRKTRDSEQCMAVG